MRRTKNKKSKVEKSEVKSPNALKSLLSVTGNTLATIASDGVPTADITAYIDTGSYVLNALLSGSIYGGQPNTRILGLAADAAQGKTYIMLSIIGQFLIDHPNGMAFIFESECAIDKDLLVSRGLPVERIAIIPVNTVEAFGTQAIKVVDAYMEQDESKRVPLIFGLDSLGALATAAELKKMAEGSEAKDMSKAGRVKAAFRGLTMKLGAAKIPMIVTNHVYAEIGSMFPSKILASGTGLTYAASTIVAFTSKRKEKDDKDVLGNIITCKCYKGRLTKENKEVKIRMLYTSGLDRHYGLLELGLEAGVIKEPVSGKVSMPGMDKPVFKSRILDNPTAYFTKEVLDAIDAYTQKEFKYGQTSEELLSDIEEEANDQEDTQKDTEA